LKSKKQEIYILKLYFLGEMPDERQWKKSFEADNADDYANDYEDGLDEDDLDMFGGDDSFEDFGSEKLELE
jgi:hypothetical protein